MKEINRRHFLKTTAAIASGSIVVKASTRNGANDRVRVAVIGLRSRGKEHIDEFFKLRPMNVEVAALCDIDENILNERVYQLEKAAGKKVRGFTDLREVLEDKSIDVVSIATPNHWHALSTIWACQAGKDVYVEKPCSHNIWEGRKIVEATRKYNRIVQHGTQIRSSPAIQEAIRKLREGVIGEVYLAKGLCYKWRDSIGRAQEEQVPPGIHYDLWMGPAPVRPFTKNRFHYNWHWQWAYGNGDIGNQGVHQIDLARWGLGVALPKKVQSMGGHYMFDDDQETPNTQVCAFDYSEEKKLLVFEVRHWITNPEGKIGEDPGDSNAVGVLFLGSEGYMEIPNYGMYRTFLGKKKEPGPTATQEGDHFANFIQAVRNRSAATLNAEIEEGQLSSDLVHLANISYRLGRSLAFDPRTEEFSGDEEANLLRSREYRSPYSIMEKN